jgi:hypothetical protein
METLDIMHTTHVAACDALIDARGDVPCAAPLKVVSPSKLAEDLASRMALVLAYGILSKFVPDVLFRALADAGDVESPPFPEVSAGAELMQNTLKLYSACCALHYTPQRLRHEWPQVPREVFCLVREFCTSQTGFGPLAWDSAGYENPNYVIQLLHSAFADIKVEQIRRRLSSTRWSVVNRPSGNVPARIAGLRRVLGFWLEFLEKETWYVRRAFYIGMVPLLRQLAAKYREKTPILQPIDLAFLEIRELIEGTIDPAAIQSRRRRYMENPEYLSLHAIEPNHLATTVGSL